MTIRIELIALALIVGGILSFQQPAAQNDRVASVVAQPSVTR